MSLNVDEIAPPTPELEAMARRRVDEIVKEWARRLHVWGTGGTYNRDGSLHREHYDLTDLAIACYVQGVRDTAAVAASRGREPEGTDR